MAKTIEELRQEMNGRLSAQKARVDALEKPVSHKDIDNLAADIYVDVKNVFTEDFTAGMYRHGNETLDQAKGYVANFTATVGEVILENLYNHGNETLAQAKNYTDNSVLLGVEVGMNFTTESCKVIEEHLKPTPSTYCPIIANMAKFDEDNFNGAPAGCAYPQNAIQLYMEANGVNQVVGFITDAGLCVGNYGGLDWSITASGCFGQ